jgi:hypothetical protein
MTSIPKGLLVSPFVFLSLLFIVLNPYFIFGKPGQIIAAVLAAYSLLRGMSAFLWKKVISRISILLLLSLIGLLSSIAHGITQFNHVVSVISLMTIALASHGLWLICKRYGISIDRIIFFLLIVVLVNSIIVVLELNSDPLRMAIEGYLDPLDSGSIDYAEGFRLRGIASSGGANLSLLVPAAVAIALYLYKKKIIGVLFLTASVGLLVFSATVIGRTGLILLPVPILFFLLFEFREISIRKIFSVAIFFLLTFLLIKYFSSFGRDFLSDKFGEDFLFYSFEFLFEGQQGLQQEGTAGVIAEFLQVLPSDTWEILFGYGFYGGGYFSPWTDSGYSRMFLSIGFIFGVIFYLTVFRLYFSIAFFDKFLVFSLIAILSIGELKEPLLFSGFVSRLFMVMVVFFTMSRLIDEASSHHHRVG